MTRLAPSRVSFSPRILARLVALVSVALAPVALGCVASVCGALVVALVATPAAAEFPKITDDEKAFGSPDDNIPAVVLFNKGDLRFASPTSDAWSEMEVWRRVKVLTDEGVSQMSDLSIVHGRRMRLRELEARTVLPDGRIVEAGDDAVFRDTVSGSSRLFHTKVAMPAVEVGAILDVHYVVTWPSIYLLSPWYFDESVPTMLSELTYHKPDNLSLQQWWLETAGIPIQKEERRTAYGAATRVWMERLPPIPDEPYSFPDQDLGNRFMVIPHSFYANGQNVRLFEDWEAVSDLYEDVYRKFQKGRELKKRAKVLTTGAGGGDARAKATALFRFVRDEIRTDTSRSALDLGDKNFKGSADEVLAEGRGSALEKTLLLVGMLDAVGVQARPAWVANRFDGRIDVNVPNPSWFDWPLVAAELGGGTTFLDPADPGLAFGSVAPWYEGMAALVIDDRNARVVEVPFSSHEANQRLATADLTIDDEGRLAGTGRLELTGARAWAEIDGDDQDADEWRDELADDWPGFDVGDVEITQSVGDGRLVVDYTLTQREEDVLGDEVTLVPSRPLLHGQPFTLPPEKRLTPVQFQYAMRDQVETTIRWPDGWAVEQTPAPADLASPVGRYLAACTTDEATRTMQCTRIFERHKAEYSGRPEYTMLQQLHEMSAKVDVQPVVLLQP